MQARFFGGAAAALFFVVVASACGGGSSGPGPGMSPPPGSPTPGACASPNNGFPPGNCTTFNASGTQQTTVAEFVPSPNPPPQVTNANITETVVVHTGQAFHGTQAIDFKTTDVVAGPNQTVTTTIDDYFTFPAGNGNVVNIGYHSVDSNGVVLDVKNGAGNGVVGQIPGNVAWQNNAAQTIAETDPDGTTVNTSYNNDGSYTLNKSEAAGVTTVTENADGSATAQVPTTGFFFTGTATGISVPTPSAAVGSGVINYTLTAVGAPTPTPAPIIIPITAWYPPNPTLASDTTTPLGQTSIPNNCAAPAFGASGLQYEEVKTKLDTVFGYTDQETVDTWLTTGSQPICQTIHDVVNQYYDFTGQLGFGLVFSSTPVQTTTLVQQVGLQTITRALTSARVQSAQSTSAMEFAAARALGNARVEAFHQALRKRLLRSLHDYLTRRHAP